MIYMSPCKIKVDDGEWGYIATPHNSVGIHHLTVDWCADNQMFTKKYNHDKFFRWLRQIVIYRSKCKFVCAPDVVGDAAQTLRQWPHMSGAIRALGFPVALAAQDGLENLELPNDFDALFVGGSTAWKLSDASISIIRKAQALGKWVHVGRVNDAERIGQCNRLGIDSVDGTAPIKHPKREQTNINHWRKQGVFDI